MNFTYEEFITRNLGFVTSTEQQTLRQSRIFIPGTGGMGGTAIACLARAGIETFIISDPDVFEVSNLNRQIFSTISRLGQNKAQAVKDGLLDINPGLKIEIVGADWPERLDEILPRIDLVINGCDDALATVRLMRKAREHRKTVIDAYAASIPSVYVVQPKDPRPEETMGYPTVGLDSSRFTPQFAKECAGKETEFVLTNSSTLRHVDLTCAIEVVSGQRKRISQAPMVWMTGLLMSYEAMKYLLNKPRLASAKGVFLNPWTFTYERPLPWGIEQIKRWFVRRALTRMASGRR